MPLNSVVDWNVFFFDYDGDKKMDFLATSEQGFMWGTKDQQMAPFGKDLGSQGGLLATTGDFTGDGKDEVVIFSANNGIRIYAPSNNGGYVSAAYSAGALTDLEAGDMDGDGDIDLVGLSGTDEIIVWRNEGVDDGNVVLSQVTPNVSLNGGSFAMTQEATDFVLVDFDKDGARDVVVGSMTGGSIKFLRNEGSGKLSLVAEVTDAASVMAVGAADVNGDGAVDILATSIDHGLLGAARLLVILADP
jgi:hypothetical protein